MNTMWFFVGLGGVVLVVGLIALLRRGAQSVDLGAVSSQWIAEHRMGSGSDQRP